MQGTVLLDRYEIGKHVGGGGMAQVYVALDKRDDRRVAVKIMNTEHVRKSRSLERFRREARLLCKLKHPNLVEGITSGTHQDRPFIIMEYIEGPSIDDLIQKRGHLSVHESLKLLLDTALALNHLHVQAHIQAHRDIKSTNILVNPAGTAKLTDFGIAKAMTEEESFTLTSSFLGSPYYMAPEQILDPRSVDIRTDLYALGAVFYEMLTGEKAFPGNGTKEILDAHFDLEAPTIEGTGDLVDLCNQVLARTLVEDPADRYQTPRELIDDVAGAVGSEVDITVPRFSSATVRLVRVVGLLTLMTVAVITGVALSEADAPSDAVEAGLGTGRESPLEDGSGTGEDRRDEPSASELPTAPPSEFDQSGPTVNVGGASTGIDPNRARDNLDRGY